MRKILLSLLCIYLATAARSQSISPSIVNATGGSFNNSASNIAVDWSVAEMTLVNTMQSSVSGKVYILTNGLLQPDSKKGGKKNGTRFTTDEIKVFPNPAVDYVEVDMMTKETGTVHMQLYNALGQVVYSAVFKTIGVDHKEKITTSALTPGTYMLSLEFDAASGSVSKKAVYTIVKLNSNNSKSF